MRKQFRFTLVLICLSLLASSASAQLLMPVKKVTGNFFRLGIKGGVNMAELKTEGLTYNGIGNYVVENLNAKTGYVAGVYMRLGRKFFVEPEFLISYKNGSINLPRSLSTGSIQLDINYSSIDVPILLGYRLGPLHVMAGPVASYSITSNGSIADAIRQKFPTVQDAVSQAYFSYTAGAGIDLLGLTLDVRYEGNITDLSKTIPLPQGVNFSQKASLWQATLGMKIL
jgi:Outer membrane protein beta-barrel domain